MKLDIIDFTLSLFSNCKTSPSGWGSFNCPACQFNGEPSPDKKRKMGVKLEAGGIRFHCFRCSFTANWAPGQTISTKFKKLLEWGGAEPNNIMMLNLTALSIQKTFYEKNKQEEIEYHHNPISKLPNGSEKLEYWANNTINNNSFFKVIEYITSRNSNFLDWFDDFHWTPEMPEHIIIPLRYHNYIYGWTARLCRKQKYSTEPKYMLENNSKFIFGAEKLEDSFSKYLILVEGPLDAIAINGLAIMGNQLTERQLSILKSTDKEIIVLADRDEAGLKLIDTAIDQGWSVSFPPIQDLNCKDALDMVNLWGRLFAIKMIMNCKESNPLKINILKNNWL